MTPKHRRGKALAPHTQNEVSHKGTPKGQRVPTLWRDSQWGLVTSPHYETKANGSHHDQPKTRHKRTGTGKEKQRMPAYQLRPSPLPPHPGLGTGVTHDTTHCPQQTYHTLNGVYHAKTQRQANARSPPTDAHQLNKSRHAMLWKNAPTHAHRRSEQCNGLEGDQWAATQHLRWQKGLATHTHHTADRE